MKGHQDKILESEAIGMPFPVDSEYFDQYSPLYGDLDIAGIQNPQPHMIETVWNGYVNVPVYSMAKSTY